MTEILAFLPDGATLAAFLVASLALNFTPGADLMFSIASGASGGPRAAVAASLGINLGVVVVHIAMAAAGLAALIAARQDATLADKLGLDAGARVLLIGSEGVTDPAIFKMIMEGRDAA